jgi:hypothetical protein
MRFIGVVVMLAVVGPLLVSSGAARVRPPIDSAVIDSVAVTDAEPVVARSRLEVQPSVIEERDRDAALGLLLVIGMFEGRRAR